MGMRQSAERGVGEPLGSTAKRMSVSARASSERWSVRNAKYE